MIEKPEVLSDEDSKDIVYIPCETCEKVPDWGFPTVECMECIAHCHREAQRDADAKYYEKVIAELFEYARVIINDLYGKLSGKEIIKKYGGK